MKKFLSVIMVAIIAATLMCVAVACDDNPDFNSNEKTVTIIVDETSYELDNTTSKSLYNALKELKKKNSVHFKIKSGMIIEIGDSKQDVLKNQYIMFYTTLDSSDYAETDYSITYDDMTLYSTIKGVKQIPLIDGATYLFRLETF